MYHLHMLIHMSYVYPQICLTRKGNTTITEAHFQGVDMVEWSRALGVKLSEWCCSVSMVWVQIPAREEQNLTALKSNSNTVWFNFQTYILFSINLVSLVTLRSSGTDILYGCHLLLDVCIIYFIACDYIMNSSLSYTIY